MDHNNGHLCHFDDFNVTYDSLLSQTQFASRYECQDLVDNCFKLQRENRKNYSLLQRQMRFYEDDGMNTSMNQRKDIQDARRRQAVVLVNRNFYRYHGEQNKIICVGQNCHPTFKKGFSLGEIERITKKKDC